MLPFCCENDTHEFTAAAAAAARVS
jgi:hypothetical protein